jgi:hypothetical protein
MTKNADKDILTPEERHLKIEEDYKKAQIASLRANSLMQLVASGVPAGLAYKMLDGELSPAEIKTLDNTLKIKKNKR